LYYYVLTELSELKDWFGLNWIVWNDLPVIVIDFRSLPSFKRTTRLVDLSKHLIGVTYTNNSIQVYYYCQLYYLNTPLCMYF